MKRLILLTIILTAGAVTGRIAAQDAASVSKRANQQYVLFESERDKGTNITVRLSAGELCQLHKNSGGTG